MGVGEFACSLRSPLRGVPLCRLPLPRRPRSVGPSPDGFGGVPVSGGIDARRTEATTGVHLPRLPALDGLRGVAVIAVLFFHDGRLRGGYLGVDLFFVLSGFLITSLLLVEQRDRGHVRLGRFYERRARRLLPAMVLALLLVPVYAAVWAHPIEPPRIRWDAIATLFYFAHSRDIVTKQSYWDIFRTPSPLQHTWSLSLAEQCYPL